MIELFVIIFAVGVLVAATAAGWLAYQTFLQNGRILLRIERLEEESRVVRDALEEAAHSERDDDRVDDRAGAPRPGCSPGTVVADFELATPDGGSVTLWEWRGREVVLVFFDPACRHSATLLARLARLRAQEDEPVTLLIGTGDLERNRAFVEAHGLKFSVLVQEEREVARLLRADGTPAAYRIDRLGRTVGGRAIGVTAVEELLRHAMVGPADDPHLDEDPSGDDFTRLHFPPVRTRSHLRRSGLRPGERAPDFTLPGLDGAEHSLGDYAGRPLLLVFTDPHCRPCQETMPELERMHRERAQEVQILAVSRGGPDANLAHIRGITFPVLFQRHWEVSREYAMFATPIAYLIDPGGLIASRPAMGRKAILDLVDSARAATPAAAVAPASA